MVVKLNTVRLNGASLNHASLNGVGERLRASAGGGGGEVIPPEEPDVPVVPVTYTLSASASNGVVSASVNGNAVTLPYTANEGDEVIVEVTANGGYEFEGWSDGSTDNPRSITMNADVTLSATCVEQVVESKYIQFADPAVEAVLMSKGVSSDGVGITMEDAAKVTTIGTWFRGNTEITSFDEFEYFTGVTALAASALEGCTALSSIKMPSGCIAFGQNALYNCTSLSSISVDWANVKTIDDNAFNGCIVEAEEMNLPNLEGTLGTRAFDKWSIQRLILGKVSTVNSAWGSSSFYQMITLKYIDLPSTLTAIGELCFQRCYGIETVICRATTPPSLSNGVFSETNSTFLIYVPDASVEAYKTATNWVSYADRIHPLSEIEGSLVFYDKLVGDGAAYINTEYMPKGTDSFSWDAEPPTVYNRYFFGVKSTTLSLGVVVYAQKQSYYLVGTTTAVNVTEQNDVRTARELQIINDGGTYKRVLMRDGQITKDFGTAQATDKTSNKPLHVFACQKSPSDTYIDRPNAGAIRSFVIIDIDGNTIMSLKPCTYYGEAGMWDEVGNKFYGNAAASGEFTAANDE